VKTSASSGGTAQNKAEEQLQTYERLSRLLSMQPLGGEIEEVVREKATAKLDDLDWVIIVTRSPKNCLRDPHSKNGPGSSLNWILGASICSPCACMGFLWAP